MPPAGRSKLLHMYGVNAWKCWVQSEQKKSGNESIMGLKEDVLECSSAELSMGLCRFIEGVRRPNGERYAPDSIFYLCLGIQQYLLENGRIENLFTDQLYSAFSLHITTMLRDWTPTALPTGSLLSRVEEEFLWECKQLGAYSPIVLLNTLLFFCTKLLHLQTLLEHRHLSFNSLRRGTRPDTHTAYLRYSPPSEPRPASEVEMTPLLGKRRLKEEEDEEEDMMEMPENTENPLRCPVRLYEFYLSKWFPEGLMKMEETEDQANAAVGGLSDLEEDLGPVGGVSDPEEDLGPVEADFSESGSEFGLSDGETSSDGDDPEEVPVEGGAPRAEALGSGGSAPPAMAPRPAGLTVKKVSKTANGKRKYDKRHYCVYCQKANSKISRHLTNKHSDEAAVAEALCFPKGSKQRRKLLHQLCNKGNFHHNVAVLIEGDGELVTRKQPRASAAASDYLPCQFCFGFFLKTHLWRHQITCDLKPETEDKARRPVQALSSELLPLLNGNTSGHKVMLGKMHVDDVSAHIEKDPLICRFGDILFEKHGHHEIGHQYLATKMRELARFVLAVQELDCSVEYLRDVITPSRFHLAVEGARRLAGYDAATDTCKVSSVFMKIGYSLRKAARITVRECVANGDVDAEGEGKAFLRLLESEWNGYNSQHAQCIGTQGKLSRCDVVPLTEDVMKLQTFLQESEQNAKKELEENPGSAAWKKLSEVLLSEIVVFNGIQEDDVGKMLLETYIKDKREKIQVSTEVDESPAALEQELAKRFTGIEVQGKDGRKFSVLLTQSMAESIEILNNARGAVGVPEDERYVFARLEADSHVQAYDCLKKYVADSGARYPEKLVSSSMRKRVATLCQMMHLKEDELVQVSESVGYDLTVHQEACGLSEDALRLVKFCKLFLAMEKGRQEHKENSLDELYSPAQDLEPNNQNHISVMEPGASESSPCSSVPTEPESESSPGSSAASEPASESSQGSSATSEPASESNSCFFGPASESGPASSVPTEPASESGPGSSVPTEPASESGPGSPSPTEPASESGPGSSAPTEPASESGPGSSATSEPASESGPGSSATSEPASESGPGSSATSEPASESGPGSSATSEPASESGPGSSAPTEPASESGPGSSVPTEPASESGPGSSATSEPASESSPCSSEPNEPASESSPGSSAASEPRSECGQSELDSSMLGPGLEAETGMDYTRRAPRKSHKKNPWTAAEQAAVKSGLREFIAAMKVPGKRACVACLNAKPEILRSRSWKDVKYYAYNAIQSNRRRGYIAVVDHTETQEGWEDGCVAKKQKMGAVDS